MGISFRRRRKVNWPLVGVVLLLLALGGAALIQLKGLPAAARDLPFMPKTPTPTPVPVDDGSILMALGDSLWQQGRLVDAADAYQEATLAAAAGADLLTTIAEGYSQQDRLADAAIKRYYAGQARSRAALARARRARIFAIRGWNPAMTAQAVEEARKAVELDREDGEILATLALAYDRDGKYDAAIQAALAAVAKDGKNAEAHAYLAEAYADKQPLDPRAKASARLAVQLDDMSAYAHRNLGYILETEGDYREAAAEYLKAIALAPNLAALYLDLGRVYYVKLDRYEDAVAALRRAVDLDPLNPLAHTELGRCYHSRSDFRLAEASLQRATAVDPGYANAYAYLGWVYYFGLRQYDKAVPQLQKALELGRFSAGRMAEYSTELGWSLYFLNRCSEARPAFQKALDLLAGQPDPNISTQARNGLSACAGR